jgi:hypothetical protein
VSKRTKLRSSVILAGLAFLCLSTSTPANAGQIIVFDPPGSLGTLPVAINNSGQITGYYNANGSTYLGFVRNADGSFVSFSPPTATFTQPTAMNSQGTIVGQWLVTFNYNFQGFVRDSAGNIAVFAIPGAAVTQPLAINASGIIVGAYDIIGQQQQAFLRQPDGQITYIVVPGSISNVAVSINASGQVCGYYNDNSGTTHIFIRDGEGNYTTFDGPNGQINVVPIAINDAGLVLGTGFTRDAGGNFTTFAAPDAGTTGNGGTYAYGLNQAGAICGDYVTSNSSVASFIRYTDGSFGEFVAAGSGLRNFQHGTRALSLNDYNSVTGTTVGNDGVFHGFLAVP